MAEARKQLATLDPSRVLEHDRDNLELRARPAGDAASGAPFVRRYAWHEPVVFDVKRLAKDFAAKAVRSEK